MSKRYALLYSSEEYANDGPTPYCHADNDLLKSTLIEYCDYLDSDIISRQFEIDEKKDPVRQVHDDLDAIRERLEIGDTLLFYYAGHGTSIGTEPFLIFPTTATQDIENTALAIRDISKKLRIDGVQCFRIFDSCHSGFDVRDPSLKEEPLMRAVLRRPADGWVTLAGCGPDEACHSTIEEKHGIFTFRLCQAIKETENGRDVHPEIVKVRTCELVEEWCKKSEKLQTPTIIATARGNISLATRRIANETNQIENDQKQINENIKSRLLELSGTAPPSSEEYWDRYDSVVEVLRNELDASKEIVSEYSAALQSANTGDVYDVLELIRDGVVDLVNKKGWCSLHTIERDIEIEPQPNSALLSAYDIINRPARKRTVFREFNQDGISNNSVVFSNLAVDGVFPGLWIVHYVCPLQLNYLLYSKIQVQGIMAKESFDNYALYCTVNTSDLKQVKQHADVVHGKAKEMFYEACEVNIKYLEREHSKGDV